MAKESKKDTSSHLDGLLSHIEEGLNKEFGSDTATRLNSPMSLSKVDYWVTSRSMIVDKILMGDRQPPCSLVPFGRQMEVAGLNGSGKTTLCAQIAAETQKQGGIVVVTDSEERIDEVYWTSLGVDCNRIVRVTAHTIEQVFNKQIKAVKDIREYKEKYDINPPVLFIWDSIGSTSTEKIFDEMDNNPMEAAGKIMGKNAIALGNGLKLINDLISKDKICYLFTNHLYQKYNVQYGDPWETYGGEKVRFFATVRLRLSHIGNINENDETIEQDRVIGKKVQVKAIKNSMAPVLITMNTAIMGGQGFSDDWTTKDIAEKTKIITKAGAWSTCNLSDNESVKYQGWKGYLEKVVPHPSYQLLKNKILELM